MPDIAGLKLIVPTSVSATGAGSSASVSATGKVTFDTAVTVSINGCFSATYDNYLIVVRGYAGTSTPTIRLRLRASGTDASGSNYARQYLEAASTSISGARSTAQTEGNAFPLSATQRTGNHLYVFGSYLAQPTAFRCVSASGENSATITEHVSTHSLSTSYDGITFLPSSSTMSGALTIYGLSQ